MGSSILVVDDDRQFRQFVTDSLTRRGHHVSSADSASAALALVARRRFDLVITDLVLPGVDGLSLIARLRELEPSQEMVLVSRRGDAKAALTTTRAGLTEYLLKPVEEADLLLAVERSLERIALKRERARLLEENLDHLRMQTVHGLILELLANPDLDWLQERFVEQLAGLCDAQSGALWVGDDRGELILRSYRGLLDRQFLAERLPRTPEITGSTRHGQPWLSGEVPGRLMTVPLVYGGELVGVAQLSDSLSGDFRRERLRDAKLLADFAAVGLRLGRKQLALQRQGLRDRDTAAYNLSYFTDYASKEIYKARRYGRMFSLLTFGIDNLPQVRLRLGQEEAKAATRGIIRALSRVVRDADVLAKASEQEFYCLLPETDHFGAMMFLRRSLQAAREDPGAKQVEQRLPLGLVGGAATFPKDGEDFDELIHRCRRRMDERRASLRRRLVLDNAPFWDEVELLLGSAESPRLPEDARAEPSRRGKVADVLFDELQTEIARELLRDPTGRGILYVGCPEVRADLPLAAGLESARADFGSRVYLLGRRADLEYHPAITPVFLEGDERIARHEFILWVSESAAYGLLQRRGKGLTWGFHSSDAALVEGLIAKLQSEYDLQPY